MVICYDVFLLIRSINAFFDVKGVMSRNFIFCLSGIVIGLLLGFFVANAIDDGAPPPATASTPRTLRPDQTELPPDHPPLDGASSSAANAGAAATLSGPEQSAVDAAERNARDFKAQQSAAAVYYQRGVYDQAAFYLERALALRPTDAETLTAMGDTKYDAGDFTGAAQFYERALAQKPDQVNVRTDLGNTYFQRRPPDYERALAEYRKSVAIDPSHEKTWQNMAAAAIQLKDKTTASEAVARLSSLNPQNPALNSLRQSIATLP